MVSAKQAAVLIVAVTIAATTFAPLASAVSETAGEQDVTNETVTAQHDTPVDLAGYNLVENSETVYGYNDTTSSWETAPGSDYEIVERPGQVNVSSSSTLIQDGEDVKVTYTYESTSGTSATVLNMVPLFVALLILGVLAAKIMDGM